MNWPIDLFFKREPCLMPDGTYEHEPKYIDTTLEPGPRMGHWECEDCGEIDYNRPPPAYIGE